MPIRTLAMIVLLSTACQAPYHQSTTQTYPTPSPPGSLSPLFDPNGSGQAVSGDDPNGEGRDSIILTRESKD